MVKLPPITEGWHKTSATKNAYIVQPNDTLYSIAWAFGMDYRSLAKANNIDSPYSLKRGQHLRIGQASSSTSSLKYKNLKGQNNLNTSSVKKEIIPSIKTLKAWRWPAAGRVLAKFSQKAGGNKGVDISGDLGLPIVASNNGAVVYSGTGLRSYGKLIIIKHNDDYLSAYAY
ncbi:LysM peptidoglycan-binding domain-containing protein, partial [bacterium]|nr:LysM peptidoglycan-binding domain-containing protein [bacterium]